MLSTSYAPKLTPHINSGAETLPCSAKLDAKQLDLPTVVQCDALDAMAPPPRFYIEIISNVYVYIYI